MSPRPTVLIVEDDPVFRRIMSFTVTSYGLRVETAANGREAFDRLIQGGIDFLVTDLQMPVCTGIELIERLDSHGSTTRPPTILCTAKGLELDATRLMQEKNLVAIMHKPFSPRKLGELIQKELMQQTPPVHDSEQTRGRDTKSIPHAPPIAIEGHQALVNHGSGPEVSIDD